MRALLQRVRRAHVEVSGETVGSIGSGLALFLGVAKGDTEADAGYLVDKVTQLRIFEDDAGKMNRSLIDVGGELLVVSQFTLYGDCSRGRRPSFDQAAPAEDARRLYEYFVSRARQSGVTTATGQFQADMMVYIENDGPVTVMCESERGK
jgi:D-tyrosyl-tRNA(Tyr) deacylase